MTDDEPASLSRVPSGVPGLDTVLGGGFLKAGLYIIQGPPGAGKTTFGNQVCFSHAGDGGRALYVTLLSEYHARMMQHLRVMSFFDMTKVPEQIAYLNGLRVLLDDGLKGLLSLLRREITTRDISMLVIDGIVAARRAALDEQAFNEFVHEMQGIAIASDCTVFMLTSVQGTRMTPEHTMVDGILELSDRTIGWASDSMLQVLKFRGGPVLRGLHAYKITSDGIVVHPRMEALLARPSRPGNETTARIASGIPTLDALLGGGLPAASNTIVMGPSGIGKTTVGLQFLSQCSKAEPGLMFGFFETPARLRAKIREVCGPLDALVDGGQVTIEWQPPTEDLLDAHAERLLQLVRERRVKRVFLDGLSALQEATRGEPGRIGGFLTALMNELRALDVTTLHSQEISGPMGPLIASPIAGLSSLGENLIMLRYVEKAARLHRLISILKVRDSDFDPSLHEYIISRKGLEIFESSDSAARIMTGAARDIGELNGDGQINERRSR